MDTEPDIKRISELGKDIAKVKTKMLYVRTKPGQTALIRLHNLLERELTSIHNKVKI